MTQAQAINPTLPFQRLGKYDLIRPLALGGMAELFLARTTAIEGFEKLVVLKRILPQLAQDKNFVTMFLDEARLAATLHHPNIAQVYDIGVDGGQYFFAMEYVHGLDLARLLVDGRATGKSMPIHCALTIATGIAAGLHYAHEQRGSDGKHLGIVHRDISPSNIIVSFDGAVKIVDFGIAKAASSRQTTDRGSLKGKLAYMSPEQVSGALEADRRSDLFSAGALLYEISTGRHPFSGAHGYAILNQIVSVDAPAPSSVVPNYPPELDKIVVRALRRLREERYVTAQEMQRDLEEFARDNKLMLSPLSLSDYLRTLYGNTIDEWMAAREQGAMFVEAHVVKTIVTFTGQFGSVEAHAGDDATATDARVPVDEEAGEPTQVVATLASLQTGTITQPRAAVPTPAPLPVALAPPQVPGPPILPMSAVPPIVPAPPIMPTARPVMPALIGEPSTPHATAFSQNVSRTSLGPRIGIRGVGVVALVTTVVVVAIVLITSDRDSASNAIPASSTNEPATEARKIESNVESKPAPPVKPPVKYEPVEVKTAVKAKPRTEPQKPTVVTKPKPDVAAKTARKPKVPPKPKPASKKPYDPSSPFMPDP